MSIWTGGRKRIKPTPIEHKDTLIANAELFIRRDKHNEVDRTFGAEGVPWSMAMLRQASQAWEEVLIFITNKDYVESLPNFLKTLGLPNVTAFVFPSRLTEERTSFMKQCLIERGARIKSVRNPREVTYMNLQKFIDAPHMTWAGANDHSKAKIEVDKPKSFSELQSERKRRSSWQIS